MINESLKKEEIEELYEMRSAWENLTDREKYLFCEAVYDLMTQFKRKNKV